MTNRILKIKEAGQSIWLDNIQRRHLSDGTINKLINDAGISGITSNPAIFMNAVAKSNDYDKQILELTLAGKKDEAIYKELTTDDIKKAGNIFLDIFEQTGGYDGFVSIELNPLNAFNVEASIEEARLLVSDINLPNVMIKVPGTRQGIAVAKKLTEDGINVNITLLFSPDSYRQVALAYIEGLEARALKGKDLSGVHSVASFFISRIDAKVDALYDHQVETDPALKQRVGSLRGESAVSVAKLTYGIYKDLFFSNRFKELEKKGAWIQRPLWASTSAKDPLFSDVKYVEALVASGTVNTLPPKTIEAFLDHGVVKHLMEETLDDAKIVLQGVCQAKIDLNSIYDELLQEGVRAFEKSYLDLLKTIREKGRQLKLQGV